MKLFNTRNLVLNHAAALGKGVSSKFLKYSYAITLSNFLRDNKAVPHFANRFLMYDHVMQSLKFLNKSLQYFEFGVFKGDSIKYWASKNTNASTHFYGFDSFEGLPNDWFPGMLRGHFSTGGNLPNINDKRIEFVKGWFNQTLSPFIEKYPLNDSQIVIHMDADVYSSTYYVLNNLYFNNYIKKGTVIIFDEVIVASIADTEFRAFWDFVEVMNISYEVLGIAKYEMAILIK